ncbi:hypothetical protein [Flagellimonas halotolerans]|uniref:hypothetical protein n=1 Tax=Flagellimonas halotolerans TaxID=3112164 RepID=UPI002DB6D9D2|nr:hypothetical protein [Muricauda sp. SYSU M86414]
MSFIEKITKNKVYQREILLGYSVIGLLPLQTDFRQVQVQEQITSAKFQTFDKFKNKGQRTKKKEKRAKTQVQSSELQSYWVVELLRTATANWHRASDKFKYQVQVSSSSSSSNAERR